MSDMMPGSGPWLVASVLAAVLASNAAWLAIRGPAWARPRGGLLTAVSAPGAPAVGWLLTALYLLLLPSIAWRTGAVSPYLMGLTETDWPAMLGVPGLVAAGIAILALAGWLVFRRSQRVVLAPQAMPGLPLATRDHAETIGMQRLLSPVDTGLHQWHFAFYRAITIGWVAAGASLPAGLLSGVPALDSRVSLLLQTWHSQPVYWGSWLGLVPIVIEAVLNPFARRAIRTPGRMEFAMRSVGLTIATTALFSFTRNFWLCLFCAVAVEIMIARWFPAEDLE